MKKLVKSILVLSLLSGLTSCTDEKDLKVVAPQNESAFKIVTPTTGDAITLSPSNPTNPGLVLTWNGADYTTPTAINYTVQVASNGTNFATPTDLVSTGNKNVTVITSQLNDAVVAAGGIPFSPNPIDIRIKATVGTTGAQATYSNVVTYTVTPYSTSLPKLGVPGAHQNWTPSNAATLPLLASSAYGVTSDYEGYAWLTGEYKFLTPKQNGSFDWGTPDYGDASSSPLAAGGALVEQNETNCKVTTPGYYWIKANLATSGAGSLTYSATPANWAIIGNGTPTGWGAETPMTYNPTTKKWTVTVMLSAQSAPSNGMKFRAGAWTLNYGDTGADGKLDFDGTNISTPAGMHTITLDMSNPRNYTYSIQ